MVRELDASLQEVADVVGCSVETLRNWVKHADRDAGLLTDGLSTEEKAELVRLRRRVSALEGELLDRGVFENRNMARMAIFDYIERFYNPTRRHSSVGNLSPLEFERRWRANLISKQCCMNRENRVRQTVVTPVGGALRLYYGSEVRPRVNEV
jgi:hypothetical protein